MCALYLYLLWLKKNNRAKYLEFYSYQQDPISSLIKTCAALQNMDVKMCPLFDAEIESETSFDKCPGKSVLSVPTAKQEIQKIIEQLKENAR